MHVALHVVTWHLLQSIKLQHDTQLFDFFKVHKNKWWGGDAERFVQRTAMLQGNKDCMWPQADWDRLLQGGGLWGHWPVSTGLPGWNQQRLLGRKVVETIKMVKCINRCLKWMIPSKSMFFVFCFRIYRLCMI